MLTNSSDFGDAALIDPLIEKFVESYRAEVGVDLEARHRPTTEPLLQHYGINTRWLDLVDSIPHALYFAVHGLRAAGLVRSREDEKDAAERLFGWIYFVNCGSDRELRSLRVVDGHRIVECRGIWEREDGFQLVDLRRAKPSKALRPHAQHGYLCRPPPGETNLWSSDYLLARIRVPRERARSWLGDGLAFDYNAMFPVDSVDGYYATMLTEKVSGFVSRCRAEHTAKSIYDPGGILRYHAISE